MKSEILSKILKNILFVDETKSGKKFKKGELLEGKIVKKYKDYLIIQLKNKGLVKAYSKIPIYSEKLLLKVIKTEPTPELKIIYSSDDIEIENFKNIIFNLKKIKETIKNQKIANELFLKNEDFSNIDNFADKIKKLPQKLGLTYEKDILEKKQVLKSLKNEALKDRNIQLLNFIENFQKINNENLLFYPILFHALKDFKKGFIGIKKEKTKKNFYTILIDLELENDLNVQILIISQNNLLQLSFFSNKDIFLNEIKSHIKYLKENIEGNTDYKILGISYTISSNEEQFETLINFIHTKNISLIDIRT